MATTLLSHCLTVRRSWRDILADASLDLAKPLDEELQWLGFYGPPPPLPANANRQQVRT